ncbi:hypothetical protein NMY22_g11725 [Coprinellus aureogranulatus]|nr:hypothetical protein NMY22_g11725 [Coprinellus aureogranulatus]
MSQFRFRVKVPSSSTSSSSPSTGPSPVPSFYFSSTASSLSRVSQQSTAKRAAENDENEPPPGVLATPTPASKRRKTNGTPLSTLPSNHLFPPPSSFKTPSRPTNTIPAPPLPTPVGPSSAMNLSYCAPPTPFDHPLPVVPPPLPPLRKATKPKLKPGQKVDHILQAIKDVNWSPADFMYYLFLDADHLSMGQAQTVSKFLKGETTYTPAHIIQLWDTHSAGRLRRDEDRAEMYSNAV